jgi:hypothetical protein
MPIIYKLKAKLRRDKSLASSLGMYVSDAKAQRTPTASLKGSEFQSQFADAPLLNPWPILLSANHPHRDYRQYRRYPCRNRQIVQFWNIAPHSKILEERKL